MVDIIRRTSGHNRYLVLTAQDASQIMGSKPNLKVYRCEQTSEAESLFGILSDNEKTNVCHKLHSGDSAQGGFIGSAFYNHLLIQQFKRQNLHMYFTGISHYTNSKGILSEDDEGTFYLVPAIFGIECYGVKFYPFASNDKATKGFIDRLKLDEMKAQQLVTHFYNNTGSMYKNGAPIFPLPEHYENHLVKLLVDGEAIVIHRPRSLCVPNMESPSEMAAAVGSLKEEPVDKTCKPFGMFIIRCEHYGKGKPRKFQLNVLETEFNFNDSKHVLQVVAQTGKPETISIEYEKNKCINNIEKCDSIIVDSTDKKYSNQMIKLSGKGPYDLSVEPNISTYPEDSEGNPVMKLAEFMMNFFIPTESITTPNVYTVKTNGCEDIIKTSKVAEIHCYPAMGWNGEIIAGRTAETEKNFSFKYDKDNRLETAALPEKNKTSFTYGGEISVNVNNHKFTPVKYSRSVEGDSNNFILKKIEDTVSGLLDSIDLIDTIGKKIGVTPAKFTVKPPNIAIGGGMDAVEHPATGVIDYKGSIYLKAKPLLSLDVEIDFFNILIIMAGGATTAVGGPAAAKFIIEMREKFKAGVGSSKSSFEAKGDFFAKLTIKGSVGGSLIWTSNPGEQIVIEQGQEVGDEKDVIESDDPKENGKRSTYTKGELVGKVGITLEAGAYAEGRILKISVKAGIGIGVSGAKDTADPVGLFVTLAASSEKNKPTLSGNVEFSGLQIYYIKFAEMSRKEGVNADEGDSKRVRARTTESKSDPKLEDANTLYTVIKDRKLWEFGEGEASTPQTLTQV